MEAKLDFIDRLLKLERRVYRIYEKWSANDIFSTDLRAFWRDMANDEMDHIAILERSAGQLNFATPPPPLTAEQVAAIEKVISTAEQAGKKPEITAEEALGHALSLESSELNDVDDAWVQGFKPDVGNLTQAWIPAQREHFQRLFDAICKFSGNGNLHKEAGALLSNHK